MASKIVDTLGSHGATAYSKQYITRIFEKGKIVQLRQGKNDAQLESKVSVREMDTTGMNSE